MGTAMGFAIFPTAFLFTEKVDADMSKDNIWKWALAWRKGSIFCMQAPTLVLKLSARGL